MNKNNIYKNEFDIAECVLFNELKKLEIRSDESIVDGDDKQDKFNSYLHVKRQIQDEFYNKLMELKNKETPQLILLTGIVGDGKSHLLSYMQSEHEELMGCFNIHSDATESHDPEWSTHDTLNNVLECFNDENIKNDDNSHKLILAINWGTLSDFIEDDKFNSNYETLIRLLKEFHAFDPDYLVDDDSKEFLTILNFSDYQIFELNKEGVSSDFITNILNKITYKDLKNPFYKAYKTDKKNNIENSIIYNYEMFFNSNVRDIFTNTLIKYIIINKKSISTRELLNCIYEVLVPAKINKNFNKNKLDKHMNELLPFLLFNTHSRSKILSGISEFSPFNMRNKDIDELLIQLRILDNSSIFKKYFDDCPEITFYKNYMLSDNFNYSKDNLDSFIYFIFFFGKEEIRDYFHDEYYEKFIEYLYLYNSNDIRLKKLLFNQIKQAIYNWKGSIRTSHLIIDDLENFIVSKKIKLNLSFNAPTFNSKNKFHVEIFVDCSIGNDTTTLNMDYRLCKLILKMNNGYEPNKKQKQDLIVFNSFIDDILFKTNNDELLIFNKTEGKFFEASKNEDTITFEEEF